MAPRGPGRRDGARGEGERPAGNGTRVSYSSDLTSSSSAGPGQGKRSTEGELVLPYPQRVLVLVGPAAPGGEGSPSPHALETSFWTEEC